jgi:hypothetical protein
VSTSLVKMSTAVDVSKTAEFRLLQQAGEAEKKRRVDKAWAAIQRYHLDAERASSKGSPPSHQKLLPVRELRGPAHLRPVVN